MPVADARMSSASPNPSQQVPHGRIPPGSSVTVGKFKVTIERYLSEGGFAHVYLARAKQPIDGHSHVVLKRIAVADKENLATVRTEVETMKKLRGFSKNIVKYIDSHASTLGSGGFEVFILMEYCPGGGIIDMMNQRLQTRLTEPEVLKIFSDVSQGVACMHYLKPPLIHRDLKVENVLIASSNYKLCDFGSCTTVKPMPTTIPELRLVEEDVMKHTTLQYRPPEMIDVYARKPISEKADIWALGVFLYKLCYYTTPFEAEGQLAILNVKYSFPKFPAYSTGLQKFIAVMLQENPSNRPNIYQVVKQVCKLRGVAVPIKDIYGDFSSPAAGPVVQQSSKADFAIVSYSPDKKSSLFPDPTTAQAAAKAMDDIVPMRRGRPVKSDAQKAIANVTSGSKDAPLDPSVKPLSESNSSKTSPTRQSQKSTDTNFTSKFDTEFSSSFGPSFDFQSPATNASKVEKETPANSFESRFPSIADLNIPTMPAPSLTSYRSTASLLPSGTVKSKSPGLHKSASLHVKPPHKNNSVPSTLGGSSHVPTETNTHPTKIGTQYTAPTTFDIDLHRGTLEKVVDDDSDDEDDTNGMDLDTLMNRQEILSKARSSALEKLLGKEDKPAIKSYKAPIDILAPPAQEKEALRQSQGFEVDRQLSSSTDSQNRLENVANESTSVASSPALRSDLSNAKEDGIIGGRTSAPLTDTLVDVSDEPKSAPPPKSTTSVAQHSKSESSSPLIQSNNSPAFGSSKSGQTSVGLTQRTMANAATQTSPDDDVAPSLPQATYTSSTSIPTSLPHISKVAGVQTALKARPQPPPKPTSLRTKTKTETFESRFPPVPDLI